eukprot:CAMPEP_0196582870 /NCGR_PEP_ID=MMETSP1081-20130531/41066_1 /TAXON_ID=36882 /ORGANISM="Pyramimonas amylifera, Strain CCMP720" /LENGTH=646 /DNA_ID=CAMNT_0041903585 /DNA_START=154 /DNA_END=2094 /DNA_ORIENTATION=-
MEIPISIGEQQFQIQLEDGADAESAIKQMTERFKRVLSNEISRRVQDNILDVDLNLDGQQVRLRFKKGEDIVAKVEQFVTERGLTPEAGQQLSVEVLRRATMRDFLPLLFHEVHVDGGQILQLPVYAGQSPDTAVTDFIEKQQLLPDFKDQLVKDLHVNLVGRGLAPLGTFNFASSATGEPVSLSLFVGENMTEKVEALCTQSAMSTTDCEEVHQEITRALKKEKLLPVHEFPININQVPQILRVFDGETAGQALKKFSAQHQLDENAMKELEVKLRERLINEGIVPVVVYPVRLASGGPPVTFPLYKGANLTSTVQDFGHKHSLSPEDAASLTVELQSELRKDGLAPLVEFNFDIGGKKAILPLFQGQNVTQQVLEFGEAHGISAPTYASILSEVDARLKSQGLAPLLSFDLDWQGAPLTLPYYKGTDLKQVVGEFIALHSLPASAEPALLQQLTQRLTALGHLPLLRLPIHIQDKEELLDVYTGENATQAAERFMSRLGLAPSLVPQLAAEVERKMKAAKIIPLREFAIGFGGQELAFALYFGESVDAAVVRFLSLHSSLPASSRPALSQEITRRATQEGLLPFLQVPFNLEGKEVMLPLFHGQDVTKEVEAFGSAHGIQPASMPILHQAVQQALTKYTSASSL